MATIADAGGGTPSSWTDGADRAGGTAPGGTDTALVPGGADLTIATSAAIDDVMLLGSRTTTFEGTLTTTAWAATARG